MLASHNWESERNGQPAAFKLVYAQKSFQYYFLVKPMEIEGGVMTEGKVCVTSTCECGYDDPIIMHPESWLYLTIKSHSDHKHVYPVFSLYM